MALGSGSLVATRFIAEVTFGTTPATPTMQALRLVAGAGLSLKKDIYQSGEVRSDRYKANVRHGMKKVEGSLNGELSVGAFDAFIEAALGGTWADVTTGSTSLAAVSGSNTFTRATGSFVTDGFNVGDEIWASGFATGGNNGRTKITAVSALSMTVAKTLASDVSAASRTIKVGLAATGKSLKAGSNMKFFSIEEAYTDISQFLLYKGCVINTLDLGIKPGGIVTSNFGFIGQTMGAPAGTTAASSVTAAPTNAPLDSFTGTVMEGGVASSIITSIELKVNNNRSGSGVVGSAVTPAVFEGQSEVNGTVTFLFQDAVQYNKFVNETASSLDIVLNDANGTDFHHVYLPNVKYTGGEINPPKSGPIPITMPFEALYDSVSGTNIIYQRSN